MSSPPAPRVVRRAKVAAVVVVLGLLVSAQRLGLFEQFAEPARVKDTLLALGPLGYVAFVVACATLQPFGVPGMAFVLAAALVWPWPVAFALSITGTMAASSLGFSFARFVARDWVAQRIPARFLRYDEALGREAFRTIFVLRSIFWMQPLLHAFFGVSRVRFSTHFWATLAGYAAPILVATYLGQRLFDALARAPLGAWLGLGAALAAVAIVVWAFRRRAARARAAGLEAVVPIPPGSPKS